MENYGLITGRTSVLLLDEKSGLAAKKRVASVQSHEIAHQWFGNYVTMDVSLMGAAFGGFLLSLTVRSVFVGLVVERALVERGLW